MESPNVDAVSRLIHTIDDRLCICQVYRACGEPGKRHTQNRMTSHLSATFVLEGSVLESLDRPQLRVLYTFGQVIHSSTHNDYDYGLTSSFHKVL